MRKSLATILNAPMLILPACSSAAPSDQYVAEAREPAVTQTMDQPLITALDASEQKVVIDLHEGPVLFIAHWCPYCKDYLNTYEPEPDMKVVVVFPMNGESPQDMRNKAEALMKKYGWEDVPLYVAMNAHYLDSVPAVASLDEAGQPVLMNAFEWMANQNKEG